MLQGEDQALWLARLDAERENVLAAHAWCSEAGDADVTGLRLSHAMRGYWMNRGLSDSGYRLTVEALARPGVQDRNLLRSHTLLDAGNLCFGMGRYDEAQEYLEQGLSIAEELGVPGRISWAHQLLGGVCLGRGERANARVHFVKSLALARERGNKYRLGSALNGLAELCRVEGDLDAAEALYEEALALAREMHDRQDITINLLNLTMCSIGRGSADRTDERVREALCNAMEVGSRNLSQFVLDVAAGRAAFLGEWERAARLGGSAQAQLEEIGGHREAADEIFFAPLMAMAESSLGATAFGAATSAGRALSCEDALREVQEWLAADR
jgi:tetratricopeptide (TPR) repeat protein